MLGVFKSKWRILIDIVKLTFIIGIILKITLISRISNFLHAQNLILFWSYFEALNGNFELGLEILLNIVMFIPLGVIMNSLFRNVSHSKAYILLTALILAICIEFLQYEYRLGLAEIGVSI